MNGGFLARRLSRKDVEGFLSKKTCSRLKAVNRTVKLLEGAGKGGKDQSGRIASELVYLYLINSALNGLGKKDWQGTLFAIAVASALEWDTLIGG